MVGWREEVIIDPEVGMEAVRMHVPKDFEFQSTVAITGSHEELSLWQLCHNFLQSFCTFQHQLLKVVQSMVSIFFQVKGELAIPLRKYSSHFRTRPLTVSNSAVN